MKQRVSVAALATISFAVIALNPTPSIPSVPVLPAMTAIPAASPVPGSALPATLGAPDIETAEMRRRILSTLPYGSIIARSAERNRVDSLLLAAMVDVESGFAASAISPQGARGLMQVRPSTATAVGHQGDLLDPHTNVEVGCRYLGSLLQDFQGDVELSLAAYNAGPAAVLRHKGIPPYRETREYVKKVMHRYEGLQREATALEEGMPSPERLSR